MVLFASSKINRNEIPLFASRIDRVNVVSGVQTFGGRANNDCHLILNEPETRDLKLICRQSRLR